MDWNNRPHLETSLIGRYVRPVFLCVRRANLGSKNKVSEMRNRTGNDDRLELRPAEFTGPWQGHCQKTAMTCHRLPRSAMACHALPVVEGSWPRPAVVRRTPTIGGVNRNKIDRRLLGRLYERDLTRFGSGLSDLFTRKGRRRPSRACHRLPHRSKRLSRRDKTSPLDLPSPRPQSVDELVWIPVGRILLNLIADDEATTQLEDY